MNTYKYDLLDKASLESFQKEEKNKSKRDCKRKFKIGLSITCLFFIIVFTSSIFGGGISLLVQYFMDMTTNSYDCQIINKELKIVEDVTLHYSIELNVLFSKDISEDKTKDINGNVIIFENTIFVEQKNELMEKYVINKSFQCYQYFDDEGKQRFTLNENYPIGDLIGGLALIISSLLSTFIIIFVIIIYIH
jgi:hypothetical protein